MKQLMLATSLFLCVPAMAHEDHHTQIQNNQCQVDFQNDVRITPNHLKIISHDNKHLIIGHDGELSVDGQVITLTETQKQALSDYSDSLRVQLPRVASIALDGVELASVALEEVAHAFDLNSFDSFNMLLKQLNDEISETFYQQGAFVMGEQTFHEFGVHFEQKFEGHLEEAIESVMMESIGSILMSIGAEMIGSGGDMDSFEARIENMGRQIEERVGQQAALIENKANSLCDKFETIANVERNLVGEIPIMTDYQLFSFKTN